VDFTTKFYLVEENTVQSKLVLTVMDNRIITRAHDTERS
jgi:hypothetical protein